MKIFDIIIQWVLIKTVYSRSFYDINDIHQKSYDQNKFNSFEAIEEYLDTLSNTVENIKLYQSDRTGISPDSIKGYPVYLVHFSTNFKRNNPVIWIDCGMNGEDYLPIAICMYIIDQLVDNDVRIQSVSEEYDFYVIPVANPEGYSFTYDGPVFWTKNRQRNEYCYGVNLNRNFPVQWEKEEGASESECSTYYKGNEAQSEVEVQFLSSKLEEGVIDSVFHLEGFGQKWMYPYAYTSDPPPDYEFLQKLCETAVSAIKDSEDALTYQCGQISSTIDYKGLNISKFPETSTRLASGSLMDYAYTIQNIPKVFTIQSRNSEYTGNSEDIQNGGEEILRGILSMYANTMTTMALPSTMSTPATEGSTSTGTSINTETPLVTSSTASSSNTSPTDAFTSPVTSSSSSTSSTDSSTITSTTETTNSSPSAYFSSTSSTSQTDKSSSPFPSSSSSTSSTDNSTITSTTETTNSSPSTYFSSTSSTSQTDKSSSPFPSSSSSTSSTDSSTITSTTETTNSSPSTYFSSTSSTSQTDKSSSPFPSSSSSTSSTDSSTITSTTETTNSSPSTYFSSTSSTSQTDKSSSPFPSSSSSTSSTDSSTITSTTETTNSSPSTYFSSTSSTSQTDKSSSPFPSSSSSTSSTDSSTVTSSTTISETPTNTISSSSSPSTFASEITTTTIVSARSTSEPTTLTTTYTGMPGPSPP